MIGTLDLPQEAMVDTGRQLAPRRYSTFKDDPGYPPWKLLDDLGIRVHVYLDGREESLVFTADEGEGFVLRGKRDERGCLYPDGDRPATERVDGAVTFAFTPWSTD